MLHHALPLGHWSFGRLFEEDIELGMLAEDSYTVYGPCNQLNYN
jgi:hypothetical protein